MGATGATVINPPLHRSIPSSTPTCKRQRRPSQSSQNSPELIPGWTLHPSAQPQWLGGRIFSRPLGRLEQGFYWDMRLEGTADGYQSTHVRVRAGSNTREVFSEAQVHAAWVHAKHTHPLLGARIVLDQDHDGADQIPRFEVSEERIRRVERSEIVFADISSPGEVDAYIQGLVTAVPRAVDLEQTSALYILFCDDGSNSVYVVSFAVHCIMDGICSGFLVSAFLDALTSDLGRKPLPELDMQLRVALPIDGVLPASKLAPARRRWRMGIASVLHQLRLEKLKGGHPMPRTFTTSTSSTPAQSSSFHIEFTPSQSRTIFQNSRRLGVTYGNAFYIALQVAFSRFLLRCYRRGTISRSEWEFRKRQPMVVGCPLSMRPFLDADWIDAGGKEAVCSSVGYLMLKLPYLPLGEAERIPGEATTFEDFLSMERFVLRSRGVKSQMGKMIRHPLFAETQVARMDGIIAGGRQAAEDYRQVGRRAVPGREVSVEDQARDGLVFSYVGSTMGDLTAAYPNKYPLSSEYNDSDADSPPLLEIDGAVSFLRCRPTEFYLNAVTYKNCLRFNMYWDLNVYERSLVDEWVEDVKMATMWYLGGDREKELDLPVMPNSTSACDILARAKL